MPTYGYRCISCSAEFERFQKMSDPPMTVCEACGGTVKKRVYPVGIQFKGSGFYVNDSVSPATKSARSAGETGSSEAPSEAKTETKPDAKPETSTGSDSSNPAESKPTPPAPAKDSGSKPAP